MGTHTMIDQLLRAFEERYGLGPDVVIRSPGRVNIIGEHTDYSNLPVLPLAIQRATYVAAARGEGDGVRARSLAFEGDARLGWEDPMADAAAPWQRYLAGAMIQLGPHAAGRGARLLIHGDLPSGGGLSSSSSLTMGLLAAMDRAWDLGLTPGKLVDLAVVSERHVGVESGGMDQTVIGLAQAGAALRIDFSPRAQRAVALPADLRLAVAYSGEEAPKGGAVRRSYNERVVGCRLAAALLASRLQVEVGCPPVLAEVAGLEDVERHVAALPRVISAAAGAAETGGDADALVRLTAGSMDPDAEVLVRPVARHVLAEAGRVDRAERALAAADLAGLGRLLDSSHTSLRDDFGCSTPALDRLCDAMRAAGALGARLTGAGFGGYAIAAATPHSVDAVVRAARDATGGPAFEVRAEAGVGPVEVS